MVFAALVRPRPIATLFCITVSLTAANANSDPARWSAMATPSVLGRDDTSIDILPAIAADVAPGAYVDAVGSRYLGLFGRGARRYWLDGTGTTVSAGAAGPRIAGIRTGVSAWYTEEMHESSISDGSGGERRLEQELTVRDFGGTLGASAGRLDGRHVDLAVDLGSFRRESRTELFVSRDPVDTVSVSLEPRGKINWQLRSLVSIPSGSGWMKVFAQGGERHEDQRLMDGSGILEPTERERTRRLRSMDATVAWMGPLGEVDLLTAGVQASGDWTRIRTPTLSTDEVSGSDQRLNEFVARVFLGAEVELYPWLLARAGGSRSFERFTSVSDYPSTVFHPDGTFRTREGRRRFDPPQLAAGLGLRRGDWRADLDLDLDGAMNHMFRSLSVIYEF